MNKDIQTLKFETFTKKTMKIFCQEEDIHFLLDVKKYLDDNYYNSEGLISDEIYDVLDMFLKKSSVNPTTGFKLRTTENRTELPFWMGSVDKITVDDTKALQRWVEKFPENYIVTEKLDGVSGLYANGKLYTRGDGIVGADISYLIPILKLPKTQLCIRGEFIISEKIFEESYKHVNSNARNMVSGLISSKTQKESLKDLEFIAYEIIYEHHSKPQSEQLKELKKAGFRIPNYKRVNALSIQILLELHGDFKKQSEFKIDGIILNSDTPYDRNTSGNPKYMFAFKTQNTDTIMSSTVVDIQWEISRWGTIVPIIIIEPVKIEGKTITRISGSNAGLLQQKKSGVGSTVNVTFSKDVIPFILNVIEPSDDFRFPSETWDDNGVHLLANTSDPEVKKIMKIKTIVSFFAKMGIKFVSDSTVSKLYNEGYQTILDCVKITDSQLKQCGFKEKSAKRILENIKTGLSSVTLPLLLSSSSVLGQGISIKRIEDLFLNIPDLLSSKVKEEDISNIDGFSDVTSKKILKHLPKAIKFIDSISEYVVFKDNSRVSDTLVGKKFVFSGFRSSELEESITNRGGKVMSAVSKKTDGLIVHDTSSTTKLDKAKSLNIPVFTKDTFTKTFLN